MWRFSGLACEMILVRPTGFLFSGRRGGGRRQLRFGFVFQWSAQRAREGFRIFFFNGPPNGPGGIRFSMVRPTGLRGFGFFFQWSAQRVCGVGVVFFSMVRPTGPGGVSFFFNGPPNGPGGFRIFFFNGSPNGSGEVSIFNGSPNGPGGFRIFFQWSAQRVWRGFVFQWFAQRVWRGFVFQWSAQRVWGGFVFQWFAQRVWGEGGPVSFGVWWWCRRFFVSGGRGPVSFRGCEGGMEASQLWSWVCSSSVFVLRRAGGPVSFRGCEGGRGASQLWSWVCSSSVFVSQLPGL